MNKRKIRSYIQQESLNHVRYGTGNIIFNTFTGSGKTTTVLKTLYECEDGFTWMYFAPYHKVIEENIELSKVIDFHNLVHLQSRKNLCLSREYRAIAEQGINITPFCENFCSYKDSKCPYYENLRIIREMPTCFAGVHSHIPTLLQTLLYEKWQNKCLFNYYDVIIIDEFPSNTIYNQISITKKDLDYTRDVLQLTEIERNESYVLRLMLDELSLATNSIAINYAKIYSMISTIRRLDFDDFKEEYDGKLLELITKERIKTPPKDIIHFLIEIYKKRPDVQELRWLIYKSESDQWHKGMIHLTISNIPSFRTLPNKVIALDGTADLPTWQSVLGEDCKSISFDIEYKNTYQLIGARYPTSTIIRKNDFTSSGLRLYELLKTICEYKKGKVLICATKRVQSVLRKKLKEDEISNYVFATFFNLRSRNSYYEDCDTCVVFHEPNIPPFQVEIIRNVLGWDEDIIIKVHREDEIKQGFGRLRQSFQKTPRGRKRENKREIFIFSSTGYKRLVPEAKYMMYDDMLSYVKGGKKRLFFDTLKQVLKQTSLNKTTLGEALGLTRSKTNHIISVLEEEGVIEVSWGKIKVVDEINNEEEFLIRVGRRGF